MSGLVTVFSCGRVWFGLIILARVARELLNTSAFVQSSMAKATLAFPSCHFRKLSITWSKRRAFGVFSHALPSPIHCSTWLASLAATFWYAPTLPVLKEETYSLIVSSQLYVLMSFSMHYDRFLAYAMLQSVLSCLDSLSFPPRHVHLSLDSFDSCLTLS